MSYIWIICINNDDGCPPYPYKLRSFKTNHKYKVGKYIRNNIEEFVKLFRRIKDLAIYDKDNDDEDNNELQDKLQEIAKGDMNDDEIAPQKIKKILDKMSDEEIIDNIHYCSCITIIQIPVNNMITL
jgi:hypothetical protein